MTQIGCCHVEQNITAGQRPHSSTRTFSQSKCGRRWPIEEGTSVLLKVKSTHITIAEFFIILPHGPNCCIGLGAFKDLVLLKQKGPKLHACYMVLNKN